MGDRLKGLTQRLGGSSATGHSTLLVFRLDESLPSYACEVAHSAEQGDLESSALWPGGHEYPFAFTFVNTSDTAHSERIRTQIIEVRSGENMSAVRAATFSVALSRWLMAEAGAGRARANFADFEAVALRAVRAIAHPTSEDFALTAVLDEGGIPVIQVASTNRRFDVHGADCAGTVLGMVTEGGTSHR